MFKAIIKDKAFKNGKLSAQVEFTDGVDSFVENIETSSQYDFDRWIKERVNGANDGKPLANTVTVGEYTPTEPEVVIPPTPTAEEIALEEYYQARAELIILKQDYDLGLIDKATYDLAVAGAKAKKPK